jgi:hypothetical protein
MLPRSTPREHSADTLQLLANLEDVGGEIDEAGEARAALQRHSEQPLALQVPEPPTKVTSIQEMMNELAEQHKLSIEDQHVYEYMELALQEHLSNLVDELVIAAKQRVRPEQPFPTVRSAVRSSSLSILAKRCRRRYTATDSNTMRTQLHRLNQLPKPTASERHHRILLRKRLRAAEPTVFVPSGISVEPVDLMAVLQKDRHLARQPSVLRATAVLRNDEL